MTAPETEGNLFQVLFNALPLPLFRVDREVEILDLNKAAANLFNTSPAQALRRKGGDILHCINAASGCGSAPPCADCQIRNSVREIFDIGKEITRQRTLVEISDGAKISELDLLLTVTRIHFAGETSVLLCLEDITELTSLRSMIPICSNCKKIRDDQQLWRSAENYFARFLKVNYTHSICPDCTQLLYPDFYPKAKR